MRYSSFRMSPVFIALFTLFASTFRTHTALQAEIAALRHQIAVPQLSAPRHLRLKQSERFLWILWSWVWPEWRRWLPCDRRRLAAMDCGKAQFVERAEGIPVLPAARLGIMESRHTPEDTRD